MELNDVKINENYILFVKKLKENSVDVESLVDLIGDEKLINAPGWTTFDSNLSYKGGMIDFSMRKVAKYAVLLNNLLPEGKRVNQSSLIKVVLLHQISKALLFEVNTNSYEIDNFGVLYKRKKEYSHFKVGELSVFLCSQAGIKFTIDEHLAMIALDKVNLSERQYIYTNNNPLSDIIVSANAMAMIEIK